MEAIDLMKIAVKGADDKKAHNIRVLDIKELTTLADYFVICHGTSSTQMSAVFDEFEEMLKDEGVFMHNAGSQGSDQWMLMDYGDVIVHIFNEESREFYGIENLWADAVNVDITEYIS